MSTAADPPDPTTLPDSWTQGRPEPVDDLSTRYDLCLYVSGATPLSARAIVNIRRICEAHLAGRYELEIVDISRHPKRVADDQIVATPTLLRRKPLPPRRFIGDLTHTQRVIDGLGLVVAETQNRQP